MSGNSASKDVNNGTKIRWSHEEHMQLARALLELYPKKHFERARSPEELNFNNTEFERVQRRALPASRRRTMHRFDIVRKHLFEAIATISQTSQVAGVTSFFTAIDPGKTNPSKTDSSKTDSGRIIWTEGEWKLFALALHTMFPDLHCLNSVDLADLRTTHMNRAAQAMPEGRERRFPAIEVPKRRLLDIYAQARAERDPLFYPKLELPQPKAAPLTERQQRLIARFQRAPEPVPEAPRTFVIGARRERTPAEQEPAPAAAEPTPEAAPEAAPDLRQPPVTVAGAAAAPNTGKAPVYWDFDEWLKIAVELHRMYPLLNLPSSETLHGVTASDVAFAQRPNLKVVTFNTLRPKLLGAFRRLKEQLAQQQAEDARLGAGFDAAGSTEPAPDEPAAPATPVTAITTDAPAQPVESGNPYEAAFKPLLDLFGSALAAVVAAQVGAHVAAQVGAQLSDRLAPLAAQLARLQATLAGPTPSPFGAIFQGPKQDPHPARPPTRAYAATHETIPVLSDKPSGPTLPLYVTRDAPGDDRTPHMPHIGIFGNRNKYKGELEHDFPGVRFTCIDSPKKIKDLKNCDKAIGMISWSSHPAIAMLKRTAGERFVPVDGSLSELKRLIAIWIASGAITPLAPGMASMAG